MAVTNTSKTLNLNNLIAQLKHDFTDVKFIKASRDYWSPRNNTVFYNPDQPLQKASCSLLHELSHANLGHSSYGSDFELLQMEAAAWGLAERLGKKYGVKIKQGHIQKCLNTYRDWVHMRSSCPACNSKGNQVNETTYRCMNCGKNWTVTSSRFNRPYRKVKRI